MNLTPYLKTIFSNLLKITSTKLHALQDEHLKKEHLQQLQQKEQELLYGQACLQEALCHALSSTQILNSLSPIIHPSDLIPAGYSIVGNRAIYQYRWMKKTTDSINSTLLDIAKDKINSAIDMECRRMYYKFCCLTDYEKPFFIQKYPAFYNGFYVHLLENAPTDVIISAAFR